MTKSCSCWISWCCFFHCSSHSSPFTSMCILDVLTVVAWDIMLVLCFLFTSLLNPVSLEAGKQSLWRVSPLSFFTNLGFWPKVRKFSRDHGKELDRRLGAKYPFPLPWCRRYSFLGKRVSSHWYWYSTIHCCLLHIAWSWLVLYLGRSVWCFLQANRGWCWLPFYLRALGGQEIECVGLCHDHPNLSLTLHWVGWLQWCAFVWVYLLLLPQILILNPFFIKRGWVL